MFFQVFLTEITNIKEQLNSF